MSDLDADDWVPFNAPKTGRLRCDVPNYSNPPEQDDDLYILCSECGKKITKSMECFASDHFKVPDPVFCSLDCGTKYDPLHLNLAKLNGFLQWYNCGEKF